MVRFRGQVTAFIDVSVSAPSIQVIAVARIREGVHHQFDLITGCSHLNAPDDIIVVCNDTRPDEKPPQDDSDTFTMKVVAATAPQIRSPTKIPDTRILRMGPNSFFLFMSLTERIKTRLLYRDDTAGGTVTGMI